MKAKRESCVYIDICAPSNLQQGVVIWVNGHYAVCFLEVQLGYYSTPAKLLHILESHRPRKHSKGSTGQGLIDLQ